MRKMARFIGVTCHSNPQVLKTALERHNFDSTQMALNIAQIGNAAPSNKAGEVIPAEITIYTDGSFTFILKSPPTAVLLKKAAGVDKGSATPNRTKVGKVTRAQIREIAETKMKDLNAVDLEGAMRQVEGTARSMGITVEE